MKCPVCGANMVEKEPGEIYTSSPPQWDLWMWCGCGYQEKIGRVRGRSEEDLLRDKWEAANRDGFYEATSHALV